MARGSERDVELVIKARDEAERALSRITDALFGMSKAQDAVGRSAKGTDAALTGLSKELSDLDTRLAALAELGKVATGLDKAANSVNKLEAEVGQATNELARLKAESEASAAAVVRAEAAKATAAKEKGAALTAANRALSDARRDESNLASQIAKQQGVLDARLDALTRTKKAYDELKSSAEAAGKSLGVSPTGPAVRAATAETTRQRTDVQEIASFRATAAQNAELAKRNEYERTYAQLLDDRDQQQKVLNALEAEAASEAARARKDREAAQAAADAQFAKEQQVAQKNARADYERYWARALDEREQEQRQATQAAEEAAAVEARLTQQAERLRGQLNPLGAAQDRYNKELAEMQVLLAKGKITQDEFTKGQALLKSRLEATAEALQHVQDENKPGMPLGLRPYELTNLSYQINDIVTGIASGQPAFQILAQQGG